MKSRDEKERIAHAVGDFQQGIERERSFRVLFDAYYDTVKGFFAHRVLSPDDCLDLTQETFLRVYRGVEGYRREADFGTWVFRIAYNTYLKWLRRMKDVEGADAARSGPEPAVGWSGEGPVVISPRPSPLDDALRRERRDELRGAIESLPKQMRKCTELRIDQDLSYRELAVVMRLSIETVKVHLFQARKRLREKLRGAFADLEL